MRSASASEFVTSGEFSHEKRAELVGDANSTPGSCGVGRTTTTTLQNAEGLRIVMSKWQRRCVVGILSELCMYSCTSDSASPDLGSFDRPPQRRSV
eukprot:SAG31_NODE_15011_length_775_cov_2.414201_2_plen_96_part_00